MRFIDDVLARLGLERPDPDWRHRARCRDLPDEQADAVFFPDPGRDAEAHSYCAFCDVWEACLADDVSTAISIRPQNPAMEMHGIRASMTYSERRKMTKKAIADLERSSSMRRTA